MELSIQNLESDVEEKQVKCKMCIKIQVHKMHG